MPTPSLRSTFHRISSSVLLAASLVLSSNASAGMRGGPPADSIDLRPAFERWELGPRIQGTRNTCSVFTVAGALEYALASKTDHATRLSVEFLNWASNQAAGDAHDGSFFSDAWKGFAIYGVCPEQDMPYQDRFDDRTGSQ